MLPKVTVILIGWVLLVSGAMYLGTLFRIVTLLRRNYVEYWKRIGSPSLFDPNSITTIFPKIIFGRDMPEDAVSLYRPLLWAMRVSLVVGTVVFAFAMAIIALGKAPA